MGKKERFETPSDALKALKHGGNAVSDKKIYLRSKQQEDGSPGVVSAGIKAWSAIDYLTKYHGYRIVYEAAPKGATSED